MTSDSGPQGAFSAAVDDYANAVTANFRQQIKAQPEDQLKPLVGDLLRAIGHLTGLDVGWRTEVRADDVEGRPDIGVAVGQLPVGHVELKRPGMGARPEHFTGSNRLQWERFRALPNLVYTDGAEWSLYRSGHLNRRVRITDDVSVGGARAIDREALPETRELFHDFLYWEPVAPGTAEGLARFLAPLTSVLRDEVRAALANVGGPIDSLAKEWGGLLFPEGDEAQFADAYAQTLTYALLLARFEGAESLRPLVAADALQREHRLLADALQLLEAPPVREALRMPIELLERAIGAIDSARIQRDGDPWLYFYEQFLGAYDPKLRRNRGVYYTPVEVVRTQVKLAAELLRTRFSKPLAFADDDVVVLDPAVGTGTYPLAVLDHATEVVRDQLGPGAVSGKLLGLADRLYAFEILVGPYSVAHLRLSQRLSDAGVVDGPVKVYLTDTLESPNDLPEFTASLLQARLTEERSLALAVKRDTRVFVCLGNPPYDRNLRAPEDDDRVRRKGGWVRYGDPGENDDAIFEDFLAPVRRAGDGVHLKAIFNDYVYFWRWALWKVFDSTEDAGIVTFITAASYLRGPGFAGMRRKMREVFDELWIIDLEGDSLGARRTENIFAIKIPVAIAIGVRDGPPAPHTPAKVWRTRLTGTAKAKLAALNTAESFRSFEWQKCAEGWEEAFYEAGEGTYSTWPKVTDVFPWQHTGSVLYRTWPIGETRELLAERWRSLLARSLEGRRNAFRETRDRQIARQYPALMGQTNREPTIATLDSNAAVPTIAQYSFRTLDRQWVIADSRVGDYMRPELWRAHGPRQMYMVGFLVQVLGAGPAMSAAASIPDQHYFRGSFGDRGVVPLWRDTGATLPNVTTGFLEMLSGSYGAPIHPERLFAYAYGILAQPSYVDRFWENLADPPPRLPITKDPGIFDRTADHGARLLHLHTYGERFGGPEHSWTVRPGAARCVTGVSLDQYPAAFWYDAAARILHVGDGAFAPVEPEIWDYSVSGMRIVQSWLGRRNLKSSGRRSSPLDAIRPERWEFTEDLLELLWVLEETLRLQPEGRGLLDEVCASDTFTDLELPTPTPESRKPPSTSPADSEQLSFLPADAP